MTSEVHQQQQQDYHSQSSKFNQGTVTGGSRLLPHRSTHLTDNHSILDKLNAEALLDHNNITNQTLVTDSEILMSESDLSDLIIQSNGSGSKSVPTKSESSKPQQPLTAIQKEIQDFQELFCRLLTLLHTLAVEELADDGSGSEDSVKTNTEQIIQQNFKVNDKDHDMKLKAQRNRYIPLSSTLALDSVSLEKLKMQQNQTEFQSDSESQSQFDNQQSDSDSTNPKPQTNYNLKFQRTELIFSWIHNLIVDNMKKGVILVPGVMVSRTLDHLARGMRAHGEALKIFTLWSLNLISSEIEHPFGEDANDLDGSKMIREFEDSVGEMMGLKFKNNKSSIKGPGLSGSGTGHNHNDNNNIDSTKYHDLDNTNSKFKGGQSQGLRGPNANYSNIYDTNLLNLKPPTLAVDKNINYY